MLNLLSLGYILLMNYNVVVLIPFFLTPRKKCGGGGTVSTKGETMLFIAFATFPFAWEQ